MYWDNQNLLKLSLNVVYCKDLLVVAINLSIAFTLPVSASVTTFAYIIQAGNLGMIFYTFSFLCNFAAQQTFSMQS